MVCKPYAILGCGLVYLHAKFYEDTLSSWSFMCFTIFARMGSKCNQPSPHDLHIVSRSLRIWIKYLNVY